MSERVLAVLLRTPEDLSKNLPSDLGDIDRASPALAFRVLYVWVDINFGAKKARFDQEVSLVSRVQVSKSGSVASYSDETKDGINGSIRKVNVERGVVGESVDGELATSMVLGVSDEREVTIDRTVRGFDEDAGYLSRVIVIVNGLSGVVEESDVGSDGRVTGLENQKLGGGEVSNDGAVLSPKLTTIDGQSL